jgi:hypothetical protein
MSRFARLKHRLQRIYSPDSDHVSRWHNQRGEALPLSDIRFVPQALIHRAIGRANGPWMNYSAVKTLEEALDTDKQILELGGGSSTPWLARHSSHVTTIEDDPTWAERIREACRAQGVLVDVIEQKPADYLREPHGGIEVAIIDDNETDGMSRLEKLQLLASHRVPTIVLDDSCRWSILALTAATPGYTLEPVNGLRSSPMHAVETTFFRLDSLSVTENTEAVSGK